MIGGEGHTAPERVGPRGADNAANLVLASLAPKRLTRLGGAPYQKKLIELQKTAFEYFLCFLSAYLGPTECLGVGSILVCQEETFLKKNLLFNIFIVKWEQTHQNQLRWRQYTFCECSADRAWLSTIKSRFIFGVYVLAWIKGPDTFISLSLCRNRKGWMILFFSPSYCMV